jgi:hypothetical protein
MAGAHVSCATGQESVYVCVQVQDHSCLICWLPRFRSTISIPIIDVARIHLMDCLISIPLMGCFSVRTASHVLLYKRSPTCPVDGK